jgi:multidrug resistance efflux pump
VDAGAVLVRLDDRDIKALEYFHELQQTTFSLLRRNIAEI